MNEYILKSLIDEYELPLTVQKPSWYGDFYFVIEEITLSNRAKGKRYKDGRYYDSYACHSSETVCLYGDNTKKKRTNPNKLVVDKEYYVKGITKLFVKKDSKVVPALFDRFETKNGSDVIYVICEGETDAGFYSFPNTTYIFPNKDDARRVVDKKKRNYIGTTTPLLTVDAFRSLPMAKMSSTSIEEETQHEKKYHDKVDESLVKALKGPQIDLDKGQFELADENKSFREELIAARADGFMLDDHAYISHTHTVEYANQKINNARSEITRIGSIRNKPYFARIDCGKNATNLHTAYIGDYDIPGFVVDWRHAEIGNAYYHSDLLMNRDDVMLALKRIITINSGKFVGYDDEINLYNEGEHQQNTIVYTESADDILTKLLLESRLDKNTHDIIKTIQGEQYDIITSDFAQNAIINGCAGSGKTMIMYHRLSYMAYNYETVLGKPFDTKKVYIISPSLFFDSSNNDLMKKLSIDKIYQAPFKEQVDNLIGKYCAKNMIIPFQGIIQLLEANGSTRENFFSEEIFNEFFNKLSDIELNPKSRSEYKDWVFKTVNKILEYNEFEKIPERFISAEVKDIISILETSPDYFHNNCFDRDKKTPTEEKRFSAYAVTSISYENILRAMSTDGEKSETDIDIERHINNNLRMLKIGLSLETKLNSRKEIITDISEFRALAKKAGAFKKMLALITVRKMLQCLDIKEEKNDDYILKCLYIYQQCFSSQHVDDFGVYILRAMHKQFGELIEDALIFVDEFQNYSSFELDCIKSSFSSPVFNLFGDYDQRIEQKAIDLKENVETLLSPNAYNINVNYRNARQITEYINKVTHKNMQPIGIDGMVIETSLADCKFEIKDRTAIICSDVNLTISFVKQFVDSKLIHNASKSNKLVSDKFSVMTVSDCKGLEFDTVYVLDYDMTDNEKYVAYTRALDNLIVVIDDLAELKRQKEQHVKSKKINETPSQKEQYEQKERLYCLAIQKVESEDVVQIKEAIFLLESIFDYKNAAELIARAKLKIERMSNALEDQKNSFILQKRCQHCGGKFKGIFSRVCRECGKPKDY